ncbi:hypothetical protein C0J52_22837 [Blattella germanica]|nr:hypothetical protein C0J52_22837 [Blattella germanica]
MNKQMVHSLCSRRLPLSMMKITKADCPSSMRPWLTWCSSMENSHITIMMLSSQVSQILRILLHEIFTEPLLFKKLRASGCRKPDTRVQMKIFRSRTDSSAKVS